MKLTQRPRRLRRLSSIRSLVGEHRLCPSDFVYPLFIEEGINNRTAILSMPGIHRLTIDLALKECETLLKLGICGIDLFAKISNDLKYGDGREAINPNGLLPRAIKKIKNTFPELCVMSDIALDPFTDHGHDGVIKNDKILNDETIDILKKMSVIHAEAGVDFVAPSDMMDGRIGEIRKYLDELGFVDVGIMAYSIKYASALYGPFRDALNSSPKFGNKRTYQMNPANIREAIREAKLDITEGADIIMIKPAIFYLDVIASIKMMSDVPVAAYNVSGEYSMIKSAAMNGWIDENRAIEEMLTSIKRSGADIIFSYFAKDIATILSTNYLERV